MYICLFINNIINDKNMWNSFVDFFSKQLSELKIHTYDSKHMTPTNPEFTESTKTLIFEEITNQLDKIAKESKIIIITHSSGVFYSLLYANDINNKYSKYIDTIFCLDSSTYLPFTENSISKLTEKLKKQADIYSQNKLKTLQCWRDLKPEILNLEYIKGNLQNINIYQIYTNLSNPEQTIMKLNFIKKLSQNRKNNDDVFISYNIGSNHFAILDSYSIINKIAGSIINILK